MQPSARHLSFLATLLGSKPVSQGKSSSLRGRLECLAALRPLRPLHPPLHILPCAHWVCATPVALLFPGHTRRAPAEGLRAHHFLCLGLSPQIYTWPAPLRPSGACSNVSGLERASLSTVHEGTLLVLTILLSFSFLS